MGVNTRIDVSEKDLNNLHQLLLRHLPNTKVWAFGSRVKWTSRPDSDLDLVVFTTKEQSRQVHNLKDALQESSLPFRVDVLVWDNIPDTFRENIKQQYVVLIDLELLGSKVTSSDFVEFRLSDLCDIGSSKRIFADDYVAEGIPFYASKDVIDKALGSYKDSGIYISKEKFTEISNKFGYPKSGDILLSAVGNRSGIAYVVKNEGEFYFKDGNLIWLKNFKSLNSNFLFYWFNSSFGQDSLNSIMIGSAQKALTIVGVSNLKIKVPSLAVQNQIATILGALDNRITLLRETNATLEAIAQALFKSWFVDFDPVHAKMQGTQPEGMDEQTAALFPDSFEESELGLVPLGWKVLSLDEIATFLNGLALQKFPSTNDDWLPVIKIAQLRKGDTVGADKAGRNIKPEYIIQNGDVLFSWSGSLEVEIWCGGEGALNQHLFKVTSDNYPKWFYYFWTKYHLEHFREIAASKATTMGHIQRTHLTQAKVIVPPDVFINAISENIRPLLDCLISNSLQAQTLADLRDTLLPRLISGQLRVGDLESNVE